MTRAENTKKTKHVHKRALRLNTNTIDSPSLYIYTHTQRESEKQKREIYIHQEESEKEKRVYTVTHVLQTLVTVMVDGADLVRATRSLISVEYFSKNNNSFNVHSRVECS